MTVFSAIKYLWVLGLIVLTVSCQAVKSSQPVVLHDIDGVWSGYTEDRGAITFSVQDRNMTLLTVSIRTSNNCDYFAPYLFYPEQPEPISGNDFSFDVATRPVNGVFLSNTVAQGLFQQTNDPFFLGCMAKRNLSWRARKIIVPNKYTCQFVTYADILAKKLFFAPETSCFVLGTSTYIKRPQGSVLYPGEYLVWLNNLKQIVFYSENSMVTDPHTNMISWLITDGNKLVESTTNISLMEWSQEDYAYIALVELYEKAP